MMHNNTNADDNTYHNARDKKTDTCYQAQWIKSFLPQHASNDDSVSKIRHRSSLILLLTGQQSTKAELMRRPWRALDQDEVEGYGIARWVIQCTKE